MYNSVFAYMYQIVYMLIKYQFIINKVSLHQGWETYNYNGYIVKRSLSLQFWGKRFCNSKFSYVTSSISTVCQFSMPGKRQLIYILFSSPYIIWIPKPKFQLNPSLFLVKLKQVPSATVFPCSIYQPERHFNSWW